MKTTRTTPARSNGLRRLASGWSEAEYRQFQQAVEPFGRIDEAMWQECRQGEGDDLHPNSERHR